MPIYKVDEHIAFAPERNAWPQEQCWKDGLRICVGESALGDRISRGPVWYFPYRAMTYLFLNESCYVFG